MISSNKKQNSHSEIAKTIPNLSSSYQSLEMIKRQVGGRGDLSQSQLSHQRRSNEQEDQLTILKQTFQAQQNKQQRELKMLQIQIEMEENQLQATDQEYNSQELEKLVSEFEEFKVKVQDQDSKMQELERIKQKQQEMIQNQAMKWGNLMKKLEKDYQEKIQEFEEILQLSVEKTKTLQKPKQKQQGQPSKERLMLDELKKKVGEQQRVTQDKIGILEKQMNEKETILNALIQKEKKQHDEIKKKETLITNFKQLIDEMNKEKELITLENGKIRTQLNQIKELFKEKLPQLGIDPNIFDVDDQEQEQIPEEEEKQNEDNSTEIEDNKNHE